MENEEIKKSKRLYFLLVWLAISIFVLVTPKMPLYAFDYLIGYPLTLVNHYLADHHLKTVKRHLKKLPNVEVVRIETNYSNYDGNIINVLVKVNFKGNLQFVKLNKESFYNSSHLLVNRFGDLKIKSRCYPDGIDMGNVSLDLGMQGKESTLFPFEMHNVRDVINHYDDIMTILHSWPQSYDHPKAPRLQSKTKDNKIEQCYYAVEKASSPVLLD